MKFKLLALAITLFSLSQSQVPYNLTKEKTIELYNTLYLSSKIDSMPWKQGSKNCESGLIPKDVYLKAEKRINFFRLVNGLTTVKINPHFCNEAQDAAFLIKKNNILTHNPTKNLKCYSQSAYNGCSKSCLGFTDFTNFPNTAFITGFIDDYGENNYHVGHRKWILYSKLSEFGYGATNNTEAIQVVGGTTDSIKTFPEYIAYPWNGYVPVNLIFPKWSFSIPENKLVDYTNTEIIMTTSDGKKIGLKKLKEQKNTLDHTIVWIVVGLFSDEDIRNSKNNIEKNGFLNRKIKVQIKNIKIDGVYKTYEYIVEPFKI